MKTKQESRCEVCGGAEEIKERKVAHRDLDICSFCWKNYSMADIISEVDMK